MREIILVETNPSEFEDEWGRLRSQMTELQNHIPKREPWQSQPVKEDWWEDLLQFSAYVIATILLSAFGAVIAALVLVELPWWLEHLHSYAK